MATFKTVGTFAIIIACFAIIYPRFLHPMVLRAFGMAEDSTKEEESTFPPHMRHGAVHGEQRAPPMPSDAKDIRQHMRPGPHPGMRAADMQKQQAQTGGRGMMGIILPMYAIGICAYLVYTLFKVFNKRSNYSDPYGKPHYEAEGSGRVDRLGFPQGLRGGGDRDQEEVHRFLQKKQQERELEDLLVKLDDTRNTSEDEMQALQRRLEETEAQMTRILQAMQNMQTRVNTVDSGSQEEGTVSEEPKKDEVENVGTVTANTVKEGQEVVHDNNSAGSSPDTESFELVKSSTSETKDASPNSEISFEQVVSGQIGEREQALVREDAEEEGAEEILLEKVEKEEKEDSSVRHRKKGHDDD